MGTERFRGLSGNRSVTPWIASFLAMTDRYRFIPQGRPRPVRNSQQTSGSDSAAVSGRRFATISRDEDGKMTIPSLAKLGTVYLGRLLASQFGSRIQYVAVFLDASGPLLDRVNAFVEAGALRVPVGGSYPFGLEGVVAALDASRTNRSVGKSVILMRP